MKTQSLASVLNSSTLDSVPLLHFFQTGLCAAFATTRGGKIVCRGIKRRSEPLALFMRRLSPEYAFVESTIHVGGSLQ